MLLWIAIIIFSISAFLTAILWNKDVNIVFSWILTVVVLVTLAANVVLVPTSLAKKDFTGKEYLYYTQQKEAIEAKAKVGGYDAALGFLGNEVIEEIREYNTSINNMQRMRANIWFYNLTYPFADDLELIDYSIVKE